MGQPFGYAPELSAWGANPTKLPQALLENRPARLDLWIVRGDGNEHANAPHPLALLRTRRERP
jgi:hypothetical protein